MTATKGFYGNGEETYFVTAVGRIWLLSTPPEEVSTLPESASKISPKLCLDVDLTDTSAWDDALDALLTTHPEKERRHDHDDEPHRIPRHLRTRRSRA